MQAYFLKLHYSSLLYSQSLWNPIKTELLRVPQDNMIEHTGEHNNWQRPMATRWMLPYIQHMQLESFNLLN
jgi:hypothetical protein